MLNFIKKLIVIMIHLFINAIFLTYKIIHCFMEKYKGNIKKTLQNLDKELMKLVWYYEE